MATSQVAVALFFASALAMANVVYTGQVLKGSVTCPDCTQDLDRSGLQVLVKCDKVKKLAMAYSLNDGNFEVELPSDSNNEDSESSDPGNCMAKIMGGPRQIYIPKENAVIPVAKLNESEHEFTVSKPLSFYKACPAKDNCDAKDIGFEASMADDVPSPGPAAPPTYYIPFTPILGIP